MAHVAFGGNGPATKWRATIPTNGVEAEEMFFDVLSAFESAGETAKGQIEPPHNDIICSNGEIRLGLDMQKGLLPAILDAYCKLYDFSIAAPVTGVNYVEVARMRAALLRGKIVYSSACRTLGIQCDQMVQSVMGNIQPEGLQAELQQFTKFVRRHVLIDGRAVIESMESLQTILRCLGLDEGIDMDIRTDDDAYPNTDDGDSNSKDSEYDIIGHEEIHSQSEPLPTAPGTEHRNFFRLSPQVSRWADILAPAAAGRIIKASEIIRPLHGIALRFGVVKPMEKIDIQLSMLSSCGARLYYFHNSTRAN